VNGSNDVNIPTVNSFIMQQNMPYAQLIIYPTPYHGAHHQSLSSRDTRDSVFERVHPYKNISSGSESNG